MEKYLGMDVNGTDFCNIYGVDEQYAIMESIRLKIIEKHIKNGVIFKSFGNVYIDDSVVIAKGVEINADNHLQGITVVGANTIIGIGNILNNVQIGSRVVVTKSVVSDCKIGNNTTVGPYAHIHSGVEIARDCRVGNYVEIKNSSLGINTKAAHLSYIGDADIGDKCNIGCGSIFVNYDGKNKHRSVVGDSVFIGSNSNIIAPVHLNDNAYVAAGTTVTTDLPKDCMCIGRGREVIKENRSKYRKCDYIKKYFGTDGIRGIYGDFLNEEIAYMCGNFLGYSSDYGTIVVGRDNRVSGDSLALSLIKGITDSGANVINLGIVATPVVALITNRVNANYGIVLSASHNPSQYNGIKVFNYAGRKLTNIEEVEIEQHIDSNSPHVGVKTGSVQQDNKFLCEYIEYISSFIGELSGLKIVLDCSNGAVSRYAPQVFEALGAEVVAICTDSRGELINHNCGATHPNACRDAVLNHCADVGFSFDGDADRVIAIDNMGNIVDGDSIIYILAKSYKARGLLSNDTIVGTYHTNLGVEQSLRDIGINLARTDIGDHYVVEKMLKDNLVIGGEQSGHIIIREIANTGDGVLAALYIARIIKEWGITLHELDDDWHYPQINMSVEVLGDKKSIMSSQALLDGIVIAENQLDGRGRVMIRPSGTEPKIRVMVECDNEIIAQNLAQELIKIIISLKNN